MVTDYNAFFQQVLDTYGLARYSMVYDMAEKVVELGPQEPDLVAFLEAAAAIKSEERGVWRSVLVTFKPIRAYNPQIEAAYKRVVELLREGSTHNVV